MKIVLSDIIGGLEVGGSIIADVATGGAAAPLTTGLIGQGLSTIAGQGRGGATNGGQVMPGMQLPGSNLGGLFETPYSGQINTVPTVPDSMLQTLDLGASAGNALGGANNPYQDLPFPAP